MGRNHHLIHSKVALYQIQVVIHLSLIHPFPLRQGPPPTLLFDLLLLTIIRIGVLFITVLDDVVRL